MLETLAAMATASCASAADSPRVPDVLDGTDGEATDPFLVHAAPAGELELHLTSWLGVGELRAGGAFAGASLELGAHDTRAP